jgi:hypothetical protein
MKFVLVALSFVCLFDSVQARPIDPLEVLIMSEPAVVLTQKQAVEATSQWIHLKPIGVQAKLLQNQLLILAREFRDAKLTVYRGPSQNRPYSLQVIFLSFSRDASSKCELTFEAELKIYDESSFEVLSFGSGVKRDPFCGLESGMSLGN